MLTWRPGHVHNASCRDHPRAHCGRGRRDFPGHVGGADLAPPVTDRAHRRGGPGGLGRRHDIARASRIVQPTDPTSAPPVGIALVLVLVVLAGSLISSPSLRGLLTNQRNLILLNLWRLAAWSFSRSWPMDRCRRCGRGGGWRCDCRRHGTLIATRLDMPNGRRNAIIFNLFGMADLAAAVGLGIMTSPGPAPIFHITPSSELATQFPLALVPTFLVPLAFGLHVISLSQLLRDARAPRPALTPARSQMEPQLLFGISVLLAFVVWGMIAARYIGRRSGQAACRGAPAAALPARLSICGIGVSRAGRGFAGPAGRVCPAGGLRRPGNASLAPPGIVIGDRPLGTIIVWLFNIVGSGFNQRVLSGRSRGRGNRTRPAGRRVLHSHRDEPLLLVTHALGSESCSVRRFETSD